METRRSSKVLQYFLPYYLAKLEKQRGCKFIESHGKPTPLLLVANKTDLESERIISTAKGRELAKKWQLPDDAFLEVSATDTDQIKVTVFRFLSNWVTQNGF